jgi:hypothetical protein
MPVVYVSVMTLRIYETADHQAGSSLWQRQGKIASPFPLWEWILPRWYNVGPPNDSQVGANNSNVTMGYSRYNFN